MLTKTAINNPTFLQQVRRAMRMAGIRAIALGVPTAQAHAFNRRGRPAALVVVHLRPASGAPRFEIFDTAGRDLTHAARAAILSAQKPEA